MWRHYLQRRPAKGKDIQESVWRQLPHTAGRRGEGQDASVSRLSYILLLVAFTIFNDYFMAVLNMSVLALVIIYRTALSERPHAFAALSSLVKPPGAVVVLRRISRTCEGVRAGNRSPSL